MINAGIGPTHVGTFLGTLNIPPPVTSTLIARQKEVTGGIIDTAKDSCSRALEEEVEQSPMESLTVSYDAGWSKRGSGRSYDSNTGHGALIGNNSKKCLDFSVRTKVCDICDNAQRLGVLPRKHDCFKNWSGSSKAMEPDMAVDMIKNIQSKGHSVDTLIMDNDCTTIAKVKEINPSIKKLSDSNHTNKSIRDSLHNLSKNHSILRNDKTRKYVNRMFKYAIDQNQGNIDGLQQRLREIVPHMYGSHDICSEDWCSFKRDPQNFVYSSLPHKKPLTDVPLKEALSKLVDQYISKADRLAFQGSSQANESFNNIVASKAPKAR